MFRTLNDVQRHYTALLDTVTSTGTRGQWERRRNPMKLPDHPRLALCVSLNLNDRHIAEKTFTD